MAVVVQSRCCPQYAATTAVARCFGCSPDTNGRTAVDKHSRGSRGGSLAGNPYRVLYAGTTALRLQKGAISCSPPVAVNLGGRPELFLIELVVSGRLHECSRKSPPRDIPCSKACQSIQPLVPGTCLFWHFLERISSVSPSSDSFITYSWRGPMAHP